MNNRRKFLGLTLFGLMMTSCSDVADLPKEASMENDIPIPTERIPLEEALENADRFFSMLEGKTRSGRRVKSVESVRGNAVTRSGESSSEGYYIVNYEDEEGFAVLSADRRLGTVFAIGEEGSVSLSDTVDNPTLGIFFNELNRMASAPQLRDSLVVPVPTFPRDSTYYTLIREQVNPRIPRNIKKWPGDETYGVLGQYSPLTISMSQILATFGAPATWINEYGVKETLNWSIISMFEFPESKYSVYKPSDYEYVKHFLGMMENTFGIDYYPGGVVFGDILSRSDYRIHQLEVPGFHAGDRGWEQMWSANELILEFLREGDILLMGTGTGDFGHRDVWLVDGYIRYSHNIAVVDGKDVDFMCHCVWGKGGNGNGYYVIFGSMLGEPISLDPNSQGVDMEDMDLVGMVGFYGLSSN